MARFEAARGTPSWDAFEPDLRQARSEVQRWTDEDVSWLVGALGRPRHKWLVAAVMRDARSLPEVLFAPLLRAAIYETNPSANRAFVEPCVAAFGHRRTNEALLDVVDKGTDFEKAGAVNALYWAGTSLESRSQFEALMDVATTPGPLPADLRR
jgi:hypothetical protein